MKELRCSKDGALRILFIFDPLRRAVLLLGGDKSKGSEWAKWYRKAIPQAEALYIAYLNENDLPLKGSPDHEHHQDQHVEGDNQ